ncbi:MAG: hypothetical protein NC411_08785 [Bacteroides sp.]|nr:hypothetical protein [Bacteroides sp.]
MADNYLEKKMEEYRAGKLAPKTRVVHSAVSRRNPGDFTLSFPPMRVAIIGGSFNFIETLATIFRSIDTQVALCHPDSRLCTPLAQKHGLRYYPFDPLTPGKTDMVIDDLTSRWGGIDVVIDLRDALQVTDSELTSIATLILTHTHPTLNSITTAKIEIHSDFVRE